MGGITISPDKGGVTVSALGAGIDKFSSDLVVLGFGSTNTRFEGRCGNRVVCSLDGISDHKISIVATGAFGFVG